MKEQIINSQRALDDYKAYLDLQFDKHRYLRVSMKTGKQRSGRQNSALHVYFAMVADALNDSGLDMKTVLADGTDMPWNPDSVKEMIWRKVQETVIGVKSTTKLERKEIDPVYDIINRHLSQNFGVFVPFPSNEN